MRDKGQGAWDIVKPRSIRIIKDDDFIQEDEEEHQKKEAKKRAYRPYYTKYGRKYYPT